MAELQEASEWSMGEPALPKPKLWVELDGLLSQENPHARLRHYWATIMLRRGVKKADAYTSYDPIWSLQNYQT